MCVHSVEGSPPTHDPPGSPIGKLKITDSKAGQDYLRHSMLDCRKQLNMPCVPENRVRGKLLVCSGKGQSVVKDDQRNVIGRSHNPAVEDQGDSC
jgi:hypothetical protein